MSRFTTLDIMYHTVGTITVAHAVADPGGDTHTHCGIDIPVRDLMWFRNADAATPLLLVCEACKRATGTA